MQNAAMTRDESKTREGPAGWYADGLPHIWLPYAQMKTMTAPLPVARTEGCRIILADGRELIDGIASWWTACHGYNHPHIREALIRQAGLMPHVMFGGLVHEPALTLARRLVALLPGDLDRVFFSESGSVAVEIALKMAVQFWRNQARHDRTRLVTFRGAYHGDTTGAMSLGDPQAGMHRMFKGMLPEQVCVDLPIDEPTTEALRRTLERHAETLAGIIVEPLVQGAGGMRFHDAATLRRLRVARRPLRSAADLRRNLHRLRPHRHDVRQRGRGHRPRHCHPVEGADRRHAAARRHGRAPPRVRRVLVGRSAPRAHARTRPIWRMRSPARPPMRRSICSSASRAWTR